MDRLHHYSAPSNPPSTQSFRLRCLYFVMLGVRTHDIISQNGVLQQIIGSNVGSGAAVMSHTYLYMIYTLLNAHNYILNIYLLKIFFPHVSNPQSDETRVNIFHG